VKPELWLPADGITLEPNADIACRERRRSVAVTAGPGAGKTELLARRADFLLRTNACPYPHRILAISFKTDAAANLGARVRERVPPDLAGRLDSLTFHSFALGIIRRFRPVLAGINQLDPGFTIGDDRIPRSQITFGDFLPLATEILERNALVLAGLRATYSHVFLDEFQDCTANQYGLIRQAFLGTDIILTAVGDTKQRIMGWAGALEGIFATFARDFSAHPLNLYQNFRSQPRLRRMQNRMIAVMDPPAAVSESSLPGDGGRIQVLDASDELEEAARVTTWAQDVISSGIPESQVAVLFRGNLELYGTALRRMLDTAGISYRDENKLQDLAAEPIAQLLVAYFEALVGVRRPASYIRLHQSRLFDCPSENDLFRLRKAWDRHVMQARAAMEGDASRLSDRRLLESLADGFWGFFGAPAIAALHPEYESQKRVTGIVDDVLDRVAELFATDARVESLARFADERGVRMMSIHKSKGLEFDAVAVVAVEREMYFGKVEEARAEFFVGISRAKRELLLTHARVRHSPPGAPWWWKVPRTPQQEFLGYAYQTGATAWSG
jgi:superfamily I DNA/RNA helicase